MLPGKGKPKSVGESHLPCLRTPTPSGFLARSAKMEKGNPRDLTDRHGLKTRFTGRQPNKIVRLSSQDAKKSVSAGEYLWIDRLFLKSHLLRRSELQFSLDLTELFPKSH